MKKFLLFLPLAGLFMLSTAQEALKDSRLTQKLHDAPSVKPNFKQAPIHSNGAHKSQRGGGGAALNSQLIGTAGNLLTIVQHTCNQIEVNQDLNTVIFVHRNDQSKFPGTNVAQYRFDVSKDKGNTWGIDKGPLTNSPLIDNVNVNGRFPQAVIFNPAGNTVADSAYIVYNGTWHNGSTGSWQGSMRGRAKLTGDTSTATVEWVQINGAQVAIAGGFTRGAGNTFWNLHEDYNGTFNAGNTQSTGLVIEKGVWDSNTNSVNWTTTKLNQTFVTALSNGNTYSVVTSATIAFDPTGQYGWIAALGDITSDQDSVYDPIFWRSIDSGQTWTGPIHVDLDDVQGVYEQLNSELINGDPIEKKATCSFQANLTVDVNGNPHLLTTVGNGTEYSILAAGYDVWDITYDATAPSGCEWKGIYLAEIWTLRGDLTSDGTPQTEDNRPQISRSDDGSKIFFFWTDSDIEVVQSSDNSIPNLFGRGIDVVAGKMTPLFNLTEGDSIWGGETATTPGGVFGGAIFPTTGRNCFKNGSVYNIPLVLTQVDYNHDPTLGLGSSEQPAAFWYVNNINFSETDFTEPLDQVAPVITLNGADTVTVLLGQPFTDPGATAFDCVSGNITPVVINSPNTSAAGYYNVLYIATDAAGNSDTVTRVVFVGDIPVADFTWSFPQFPSKAQFTDQSTNFPTNWFWTFGDATGSSAKNPVKQYTANGTFNVCLKAGNSFGQSPNTCKDVTITGVGINDIQFASTINVFPNPTSGKVNINFEGNVTSDMTITVYNLLGEAVIAPTKYNAGASNIELNLNDAANGLYLVKIQSDKSTAIKQLTLQRK